MAAKGKKMAVRKHRTQNVNKTKKLTEVIFQWIVAQLGAEDWAVGSESLPLLAGLSSPLPLYEQHPVQAAGDDPPEELLQVKAGVGRLADVHGKVLLLHSTGVQQPPRRGDGGLQGGQPLRRLLGALLRQPSYSFLVRLKKEFAELPAHLINQPLGRLPNWLPGKGGHVSSRHRPRVDRGHQVGAALHHRRAGRFRLVAGEDRPQRPAHQVVVAVDGRPAEVVDQQLVGGGRLDQAGQPLKVGEVVHGDQQRFESLVRRLVLDRGVFDEVFSGDDCRKGDIPDHRQQADPVDHLLRAPFRTDLCHEDAQLHRLGTVGVDVEEGAAGEERPVRAARLRQLFLQDAHLLGHLLQAIGDELMGVTAGKEVANAAGQAFHLWGPGAVFVVVVYIAAAAAAKVRRVEEVVGNAEL